MNELIACLIYMLSSYLSWGHVPALKMEIHFNDFGRTFVGSQTHVPYSVGSQCTIFYVENRTKKM